MKLNKDEAKVQVRVMIDSMSPEAEPEYNHSPLRTNPRTQEQFMGTMC